MLVRHKDQGGGILGRGVGVRKKMQRNNFDRLREEKNKYNTKKRERKRVTGDEGTAARTPVPGKTEDPKGRST